MPWHPRTSLKIIGSAVQKNLSPLSQAKYYSQLFTGVHHPNIATRPTRYADPGLRHSERLLDCTALSPDCRAAGSHLRMLLRPCPKSRPFPQIDPCWRQRDTDRIHNSPPPPPKQLSAQEVPQKEVFKPVGFQRTAEI